MADEYEYRFVPNSEVIRDVVTIGDQMMELCAGANTINLIYILVGADWPAQNLIPHLNALGLSVNVFTEQTSKYGENKSGNIVEWVKELSPLEQIELISSMSEGVPTFLLDDLVQDGSTLDVASDELEYMKRKDHRSRKIEAFSRDYRRLMKSTGEPQIEISSQARYIWAENNISRYLTMPVEKLNAPIFRGVLHVKPDYAAAGQSLEGLHYHAQVFETPSSGLPLWVAYEYKPETWRPLLPTIDIPVDPKAIPPWVNLQIVMDELGLDYSGVVDILRTQSHS